MVNPENAIVPDITIEFFVLTPENGFVVLQMAGRIIVIRPTSISEFNDRSENFPDYSFVIMKVL